VANLVPGGCHDSLNDHNFVDVYSGLIQAKSTKKIEILLRMDSGICQRPQKSTKNRYSWGSRGKCPHPSGPTAELVKICGVANEDEPPTKLMRELRDIRGLQFPCPVSYLPLREWMSSPLDLDDFDRTLDSWLLLHWTSTCQSLSGSSKSLLPCPVRCGVYSAPRDVKPLEV
jgi:hypothetical protein